MHDYNLPREFVDFPLLCQKVAYYIWEKTGLDDPELNGLMAYQLISGVLGERKSGDDRFPYYSVTGFVDSLMIGRFFGDGPAGPPGRNSMIDALARHMVAGTPAIKNVGLTDPEPQEQVA